MAVGKKHSGSSSGPNGEDSSKRRTQFLQQGLVLLGSEGPRALTATRLAQELNVTSGSFYWHFKSVGEFQEAVMCYWKDVFLTELVAQALEQAEGPEDVLRSLSRLVLKTNSHNYDKAMRSWAKSSSTAARIIEEADKWRGRQMSSMIGHTTPAAEIRDRVDLMGTVWRGSEGITDPARRVKLMGMAANENGTTDSD